MRTGTRERPRNRTRRDGMAGHLHRWTAAAAAAGLLLAAAPAGADVLAGRMNQQVETGHGARLGTVPFGTGTLTVHYILQPFETGSHGRGYEVSAVLVAVKSVEGNAAAASVSIETLGGTVADPRPGTKVADLRGPGTISGPGIYWFEAPPNTTLDPNQHYIVRISEQSGAMQLEQPNPDVAYVADPTCGPGGRVASTAAARRTSTFGLLTEYGKLPGLRIAVHGHAVGTRRPMDWDISGLGRALTQQEREAGQDPGRSFAEGESKKFAFALTNDACFYDRDEEAEIEVAFATRQASTSDYTVSVNAQVLQPRMKSVRGHGNTFSGSHPHYRIPFPPRRDRVEVVVTAVDDDTAEGQETLFLHAYDDTHEFDLELGKSLQIFIRANDRSPTLASATFGTETAALEFNAPIRERSLTGTEAGSTLRAGLYFGIYESETKPTFRAGAPPLSPSQYAETVTINGTNRVSLRFEQAFAADSRQWLIYDRLGVYSPLQGAGGGVSGPVQDFVTEVLSPGTGSTDPALAIQDASGTEGTDTEISFTVQLDKPSNASVTVDYDTNNGTATAGDDFRAQSGTLTFSAGTTEQTITVPIIDDDVEDSDEEFTVRLDNASGAVITDDTATGTIYNDESDFERDDATDDRSDDEEDADDERDDEPAANRAATGAPAISGTARVDETLTASTSGVTDPDGFTSATFAYQWLRSDSAVSGATRSSYTLTSSDEGHHLKVRVSFTDDAGNAESLTSTATAEVEPAPEPLTASFSNLPAAHDGEGTTFTFALAFSEHVEGLSFRTLRDEALDATGGAVRRAKRQQPGSNLSWTIHVEPASHGPVTIRLPAGSVETRDGRALSNSLAATVAGPVGISVADARVEEAAGAVLAFVVTLDRAASGKVPVDYTTANGTATAGQDYTATSGTLRFPAGETSKTIEVMVLDDSHDEGEETLTLRLSNPSRGRLADGEATGTIENRDPLPRAFMARFGRTVAVQVVEQVEERIQAPRQKGFRGRVAGRELRRGMEREVALGFLNRLGGLGGANRYGAGLDTPMAGSPAGGGAMLGRPGPSGGGLGMAAASPIMGGAGPGTMGAGPDGVPNGGGRLDMGLGSMGFGGDSLLTGSAFAFNRETGSGGMLSFWSRGAQSSFHGREGDLSLDGRVRTTMFGADYARGPLLAGLSLANSRGRGGYSGADAGEVTSSVTGLYPWLGYKVSDRITLWGVTGYGKGALRLTPGEATTLKSGLSMAMAAGGMRGELADSVVGGFGLAFKADALWVGTGIEGVEGPAGRLAATAARVTRFRTGLEASRGYSFKRRLSLEPRLEIGLRRDGGDAETGAGIDLGGGLIVSDTLSGLSADVRVRMLLVHQDAGFRERGVSVSFSYNPTPQTPLGFLAKVTPSWGGQATSGAQALWGRETMAGMAHGGASAGNRLQAEMGYGLPVGSRLVGTPRFGVGTSEYGRDYRLGYGMTLLERDSLGFELGVDAQRRENPLLGGTDNGVLGRATVRW